VSKALFRRGALPSGGMLRQYLERIVFAGLLAAAALIVATKGGVFPKPVALLDVFLFAALTALISTGLLVMSGLDFTNGYVDLVWRVVTTGLQSLAGALGASAAQSALHFPWALTWHVVAGAMVLSFLKNAPAALNPHTVGASPLLPTVHELATRYDGGSVVFTVDGVEGHRVSFAGGTMTVDGGGGGYARGFGEGLDTALRRRE
jgi:hypothetical protein